MKRAIILFFVSILCFFCMIAPIALSNNTAFPEGQNYLFYCGSSSSQARQVNASFAPAFTKLFLFDIRGESTFYTDAKAENLIKTYHAQVLWKEESCGVINYYCYSSQFKNCIFLRGKKVNLHIAEKNKEIAIGTPIIFGGF